MKITLDVSEIKVNVQGIVEKAENDPRFWTFAATAWHKLYEPYVPFKNGILYNQVSITPKQIEHTAPYAHYQYEGQMYGPNIPIMEGKRATGYFSPPNRAKRPTGKSLKYSHEQHPKATSKWDKAAEPTQGPKLAYSMQAYIDQGRLKLE